MAINPENVTPDFRGVVRDRFFRNGLPPHGAAARAYAQAINFLLARMGPIIPGKDVRLNDSNIRILDGDAGETDLWATRYRASPDGNRLVAEVHLIPSPASSQGTPYWCMSVDGLKATDALTLTQANNTHSVRKDYTGGSNIPLDDVFIQRQEIVVQPNKKHTVRLRTNSKCRVVGWWLREKPRNILTAPLDKFVDYSTILPLSPILDGHETRDVKSLFQLSHLIWEKIRGCHVSWSADDMNVGLTVTATSATNIWDSTDNVTVRCPTQYRNSLMGASIPICCWAIGAKGGAGNLVVRFVGANGNTELTFTGAQQEQESQSLTLNPASGGDSFKIQAYSTASTTGHLLYAAGMFPLLGG